MANVMLLCHTPDPEKAIASAARLCYSSARISDLIGRADENKDAQFVHMLAQMGHESPIEHVSFTFGIEGVSRALLAQITRHRLASYSVQSQRYVREAQFEYVMPPEIADCPEAREAFCEAMRASQKSYDTIAEILKQHHEKSLIEQGIAPEKASRQAEKRAIEDARFVLPNACGTKMIVTMNARSLYHFFEQRCCNRAQWEIRAVADKMLELVLEVAPTLFSQAGPACCRGACSEGKYSCQKAEEVRGRIAALHKKPVHKDGVARNTD